MVTKNFFTEEKFPIPIDSHQYTHEFIERNNALVLWYSPQKTIVGITDKTSQSTINLLSNFHSNEVEFKTIKQSDISAWLGNIPDKNNSTNVNHIDKIDSLNLDKIENDAPTVNLVNSICVEAIEEGASDIHIESGQSFSIIRYRIDGILKTVRKFENSKFAAISSRIKIMANLNILEKRQPQDGRITVNVNEENIDFRVSIVPITGGESIVLRILGKNLAPEALNKLGFSAKQLSDIKNMIKIPHGLILVTGPTGSGKTTTLNAIMKELVCEERKIISIEDPVEFIVNGVNQIQINEQIGLGFDSILRRVLRQDPNIIMVGEIRDRATAELSVRAALTGHLVLSTIHTNDAISVISRLVNMGIEPFLIATVLKGIISQRLVRTMNNDYTDFKGRTVISETLVMSDELEELIINKAHMSEIRKLLKKNGMIFIAEDAKEKISKKITTIDEVEKEINI